ncbi:MAG: sensor histidine kinase [Anaerostipes sp.]|nr:sensor histidine kinase [Anaerostipes sp.]
MNQSNRNLNYLKIGMCTLNFIIICFLAVTILITTYRVENQYKAREFLNEITYMPREPMQMIFIVFISFFLLILVMEYRNKIRTSSWIRMGIYGLELALCLVIIRYLYVGYNGIILLVIADIAASIIYKQNRYLFIVIMCGVFVFADYNLLSTKFSIISFQEYLSVYPSGVEMILLGIRNVMVSLNIIVFGMYMIVLMRNQMKENARIALLNIQLQTANSKLQDMNVKLQDYAMMQEKMGETKERNRVAREIHDTLGHTMTGLSAGIDACIAMIDYSVEGTKKQLSVLSEVSRQGIKDIRRSVNKLRPDALEHLNLEDAIKKMMEDTMAVSDVKIYFTNHVNQLKFNTDEEDVIYRVVQESITNAIRHGRAEMVWVTIEKKDKWLTVLIHDNGQGCENVKEGFGLVHMEERIQMLQGKLSYLGGHGFTVKAEIPIRWGENYD